MACMEHDCQDCGHTWFDNERAPPCPECHSVHVSHFFDEQDSDDIEIEEDEVEEETEEETEEDFTWEEVDDKEEDEEEERLGDFEDGYGDYDDD
jgi:hypothetical protein